MNIHNLNKETVYYLASPYSSPNSYIKQLRYEQVEWIASILIANNFILIEPIASCHHKALKYHLDGGFEYWKNRDFALIRKCDALLVAKMDGWRTSRGVTAEIEYAKVLNKPIFYLEIDLNMENPIRGYKDE